MSDNTHSRSGSDRLRINLNEDYEVAHWTRKFGISHEVLKDAIDEVATGFTMWMNTCRSAKAQGIRTPVEGA